MTIDFKKIKKEINYIDIDQNTEYNTLDFNNKSNITYVFGVNGSGKSTICNVLNNDYCDKNIELFSYENNIDISSDQIIINKNIKLIGILRDELYIGYITEISEIIKELKALGIFSTLSVLKNFIISDDSYFGDLCYKKTAKNPPSDLDEFISSYITDQSKLNTYKKIIINNKNKNVNYHNLINSNIEVKQVEIIRKLLSNANLIYEDAKDIFENYLSGIEPNVNLKFIKDIVNFLELNNWDLNKCPICNESINLTEVTLNFKNIFNKNSDVINNNNLLKELKIASEEMEAWNCDLFISIMNDLNTFLSFSTFAEFMKNLQKLIINLDEFIKNFIEVVDYIKFIILEKYYIVQNNEIMTKLNFLDKIQKLETLEKEKIIFDVDAMNLISDLISHSIGENRLFISIDNGDILIDNNVIDDEVGLSTGEKNFVYLAFSLLIYAKNKDINKILLIDDPASSLDSNNKFNIIYLINYFTNKFLDFKIIVFTHNIDILNTQFLCNLSINPKLYMLKNTKNLFLNDEKTGFIEIQFKDMSFLSMKEIRKFIIGQIDRNEINDKFCNLNASSFTMLLPIIRAFLYINNEEKEKIDIMSKIMHYKKDLLSLVDNAILVNIFKDFYRLDNIRAQSILKNVLMYIDEFNNNEFYKSPLNFELFKSPSNMPSELVFESMRRIINMFFIRIFIEKKLVNNIIDGKNENNIRKLIDKSDLSDKDKSILKCKRLLFNHYMHIENVPNLVLPALEISCSNELKEIKSILNIFEKDTLWINHN